jgi:hypothetical protein
MSFWLLAWPLLKRLPYLSSAKLLPCWLSWNLSASLYLSESLNLISTKSMHNYAPLFLFPSVYSSWRVQCTVLEVWWIGCADFTILPIASSTCQYRYPLFREAIGWSSSTKRSLFPSLSPSDNCSYFIHLKPRAAFWPVGWGSKHELYYCPPHGSTVPLVCLLCSFVRGLLLLLYNISMMPLQKQRFMSKDIRI